MYSDSDSSSDENLERKGQNSAKCILLPLVSTPASHSLSNPGETVASRGLRRRRCSDWAHSPCSTAHKTPRYEVRSTEIEGYAITQWLMSRSSLIQFDPIQYVKQLMKTMLALCHDKSLRK